MRSKKNLGIELLRFIFAMGVLLHHVFKYFFDNDIKFFILRNGWIGVEFFFLVSGFLLAKHVISRQERGIEEKASDYILGRYKMILPPHLLCFAILFVEFWIFRKWSALDGAQVLFKSIPEMLLVQMGGVQQVRINTSDWYLSSLILCSAAIYPFIKRFGRTYTGCIAPLLSLVTLGILYQKTGGLTPTDTWMGFFLKGTVRAFAELNMGVFIYEACKKLDETSFTKVQALILRLLESFGYLLVFAAGSYAMNKAYYFPIFLVLTVAVAVSFSRWSVFHLIIKGTAAEKVMPFLGRSSFYIFLFQMAVLVAVKQIGFKDRNVSLAVSIAGSIVFGIIFYLLFEKRKKSVSA